MLRSHLSRMLHWKKKKKKKKKKNAVKSLNIACWVEISADDILGCDSFPEVGVWHFL